MTQHVDAIYEDGVFRPQEPVSIANGQRVRLTVDSTPQVRDDLSDVADLLDAEFMEACRQRAGHALPLDEIRSITSVFTGSLSDLICQERDER